MRVTDVICQDTRRIPAGNDVERSLELDEEIFDLCDPCGVVFVRFEELIPSQVDLAAPL